MINEVTLVGRLRADAELVTAGQSQVCKMSVATSESWKDKAGEWQEQTEWHKVVLWGKSAEYISSKAVKGSLVFIKGKIKTRKYEDKDGVTKYVTEVVASSVKSLAAGPQERTVPNMAPGANGGEEFPW